MIQIILFLYVLFFFPSELDCIEREEAIRQYIMDPIDALHPNLELFYNCSEPNNVTILTPPDVHQNLKLAHTGLCITRLPGNICDFPNIVSVRLENNSIQAVSNLSCLENLRVLDLSNNYIETIGPDTIGGLKRLEVLFLGWNKINSIEPYTFNSLHGLLYICLRTNKLKTVDIAWLITIKHGFKYFDLSNNEIDRLTNVENWRSNQTKTYESGFVDLRFNNFTTWVTNDVKKLLGANNLNIFGQLISWGFDLRNNSWHCDCNMYEYRVFATEMLSHLNYSYLKLYCHSPPHLNGAKLYDVPLSQLVCNITEKCPVECLCQNQPENGHLLVDCRNGNLTQMPTELPSGNLKLLLTNNKIQVFEERQYLHRLKYVDVSQNNLKFIMPSVFQSMSKRITTVNLASNNLSYLPKEIQNIDFKTFRLKNNPFVCDCNSSWMYSWLSHQGTDVSGIKCSMSDGQIVEAVKADSVLRCDNITFKVLSAVLGSIAILLLVALSFVVFFRYEAAIIFHSTMKKFKNPKLVVYDMFVSMEIESESDRIWAANVLLPEIERNCGLKIYFIPRDMDPGMVRTDEVIKILNKSNTALIILSSCYLENPSNLCEFNIAYDILVRQRRGRLIIVKSVDTTVTDRGPLKGFIRLKKYLKREDPNVLKHLVRAVKNELSINNHVNDLSLDQV